jgi:peroxiredoxin
MWWDVAPPQLLHSFVGLFETIACYTWRTVGKGICALYYVSIRKLIQNIFRIGSIGIEDLGRTFMKSSTVVVIILGVVAVCFCMAVCVSCLAFVLISDQMDALDLGIPVETGQPAPDFQLATLDGELVSLQDFRGQPVLLNFWAVWCGPCLEEMPVIQDRFRQHYPDLVVLAIEEGDSPSKVRDYIEDEEFSFVVLLGSDEVAKSYNVFAFPTSFFIDADGVVQSVVVGGMTADSLDLELQKIGVND